MQTLQRIDEKEIKKIIAEKYGIRVDDVCLYHEYEFIKRGDDKVRHDFIYGIVDFSNKNYRNTKEIEKDIRMSENKTGEWIPVVCTADGEHHEWCGYKCSNCGGTAERLSTPKFCPNCGKPMKRS